jgi:hypothetical protein
MLEGTKHEKAVLVLLAYIIGLTSGFIGFGINNFYQNESKFSTKHQQKMMEDFDYAAPVLRTTDKVGYFPPTGQPPQDGEEVNLVHYENGQLTVSTNDGPIVLSVHVDQLGDNIPELLALQGHHVEPPVYVVSPGGRYVYFCEQHLGVNGCTNLLFDKEAISIQYVQVRNEKLISPVSLAASAYWAAEGLSLGEFISESISTPWKLVPKSE